MQYLGENSGSAEEELDFSFERIFRNKPELLLAILKKMSIGKQDEYIERLAWGFANNYWYGVKNSNRLDYVYTADANHKPVLNKNTYRKVFFEAYPSLAKSNAYKAMVDQYLKTIECTLDES